MSRRKPARTTSLAFGDGPEAIWPQMKGFSSASREMLQVWSLGISKAFHEQQRLSKVNFASLAHTRSLEAYSMAEQSRPTLKHPQEIAWRTPVRIKLSRSGPSADATFLVPKQLVTTWSFGTFEAFSVD